MLPVRAPERKLPFGHQAGGLPYSLSEKPSAEADDVLTELATSNEFAAALSADFELMQARSG
jgi:hypothetical protein